VQFLGKGKEETEPPCEVGPSGCREVMQGFGKRDAFSGRGKRLPSKGEGVGRHMCVGETAREPSTASAPPLQRKPLQPARPAPHPPLIWMDDSNAHSYVAFRGRNL